MLRHLIPNLGSLLVVSFTLGVVAAVQSETALSFIGFGVQPPDVSLGTMLSDGANTVSSAPWLFFFPAALVTLLTVSMALIGDGLRDALDPTSRSGGPGVSTPVLSVRDLRVSFPSEAGRVDAVRGVDFDLHAGPDAGHRRRVRLGQVGHLAGGDGPAAGATPRSPGRSRLERPGAARARRPAAVEDPRPRARR